jgi:predicted Zn-dependent peptidase
MGVINDAIAVVRGGSFQRSALQDYAEDSALSYYLANQTSAQQADFLATSLLLRGRPQSVQDWVETLKGVQGYQVRAAADRYMDNIQYGFLGSGEVPRDRMLRF